MKLELLPNHANKQSPSVAIEPINLHLTIQFNEQREQLIAGHIKFGLKGGKLSFNLSNGKISLPSGYLSGSYKLAIQHEQPRNGETPSSAEDFSGEEQLEIQQNFNFKKTGRTDNLPFTTCRIIPKGTQKNPVWVFGIESNEPALRGLLKNTLLATIDVIAKPCHIEAVFQVSPHDLCLTEAEGLWSQNISKKRRVVIERAIARHFFKRKLMPYLSRQEIRYD